MAEFRPAEIAGAQPPTFIAAHKNVARRAALLMKRVGAVLLRRARFVGRFIYWTWMHGTPKHAAWVCNYEGLYW